MGKQRAVFFAAAVFLCLDVFCAEQLSAPRWQVVTPGQVSAQPIPVSYGFAAITDGRMLTAYTFAGSIYWNYVFNELPNWAAADGGDFIYAVSGNSRLQKLNPSGKLLWKIDTKEKIIFPPLPGRDGRVFAAAQKSLSCYDTRGKRKWLVEIPPPRHAPLELNDGSLLVITQTARDGKTKPESTGIRISPFGEPLEEIEFTGTVSGAAQTNSGVLLTFTSGMYGLCAVKDSRVLSVWTTEEGKSGAMLVANNDSAAILFAEGSKTGAIFFDPATGNTTASVLQPLPLNPRSLSYAALFGSLLVASDSSQALAVDAFALTKKSGEDSPDAVAWHVTLPARNSYLFIAYGHEGDLFLSGTNWVTEAYRVTRVKIKNAPRAKKTYQAFIAQNPSSSAAAFGIDAAELAGISAGLRQGDYGGRELYWLKRVQALAPFMLNRYAQANPNYRADDSALFPITVESLSALEAVMGDFGSDAFAQIISRAITNETDPTLLRNAFKAAASIAYDPEGVMLNALEFAQHKKGDGSITPAYIAACDAVFAVCDYMGTPAYLAKGRAILNVFYGPRFDKQVRDHALTLLKKLPRD